MHLKLVQKQFCLHHTCIPQISLSNTYSRTFISFFHNLAQWQKLLSSSWDSFRCIFFLARKNHNPHIAYLKYVGVFSIINPCISIKFASPSKKVWDRSIENKLPRGQTVLIKHRNSWMTISKDITTLKIIQIQISQGQARWTDSPSQCKNVHSSGQPKPKPDLSLACIGLDMGCDLRSMDQT